MAIGSSSSLRFLVACSECKRQFDAADLAPGSRFHCSCGAAIAVPRRKAFDADVVRCSSCSAPRQADAASCSHCGADFTLHERDLQTICPQCMARISDRARFCHNCATPIVPTGRAGEPTDLGCPVCGKERKLNSRRLGQPQVTVLECGVCAGMWIGRQAFEIITEKVRATAATEGSTRGTGGSPADQPGPLYRRCPECNRMMNRRNFGKRSGVVIDTCKNHGIWFDAEELERILRWIRQGGEARSRKRTAEEQARKASAVDRFMTDRIDRMAGQGSSYSRSVFESRHAGRDTLGEILGALFDL